MSNRKGVLLAVGLGVLLLFVIFALYGASNVFATQTLIGLGIFLGLALLGVQNSSEQKP